MSNSDQQELSGTFRFFCWTAQKWTAEHEQKLTQLVANGKATYIVFQHEICPKTGKEHLQGYVEFGRSQRWNKLTVEVGRDFRPHIEPRNGTPQQASDYCKKLESRKPGTEPFEDGVLSGG